MTCGAGEDAARACGAAIRRLSFAGIALLTAAGLGGCALGPRFQRPSPAIPARFAASAPLHAPIWPRAGWWQGFGSLTLDTLIAEAEVHNPDILSAIAQERAANAQVEIAGASLLPSFTANASETWQRTGGGASSFGGGLRAALRRAKETRIYSLNLASSYEADFWEKNLAAEQSAQASLLASRFNLATVALTVVSSVADTWFTALALADQVAIERRNLAVAEQILAVIRGQLAAGTVTILSLAQQEAQVAAERATIPNLVSQLRQEVIALDILVGRPPEDIMVKPDTLMKLKLPLVTPGLPSALLARRPDVANAEAQLVAANANIRAARAAFFPAINLTGSGGYQSLALTSLIEPGSILATVTAGVAQTVFDNGAREGQLRLNEAQYGKMLATYRRPFCKPSPTSKRL